MSRGRPPTVETSVLVDAILKHKDVIVLPNGTEFVSGKHEIWTLISEELLCKVKGNSLYSYVVNDRFNLKQLLLGIEKTHSKECHNTTSETNEDSLDEKSNFIFQLTFGKQEFASLIIESARKFKDKSNKTRIRTVNILKPGEWAELISKKIYDDFKLCHGYHFKNHYINSDKTSGSFEGHCKCGSNLKGQILPSLETQNIIKIECTATPGNGICGKRQLRCQTREKVVSELEKVSVEAYRKSKAAALMKEGDSFEPPHLYEANVLRNARCQEKQKQYRDKDPIIALSKFKRSEGLNIVRDIGNDPVKVLFWSSHQNRSYNHLTKVADCCLCIDATGKLALIVEHVDGQMSQHIFLYLGVLSTPNSQFAVPAMFSERQDTVTIMLWLTRWIQSGAEYPKEVVCDCSRALLNGCCRSFTGIECREIYAEILMSGNLPRTYIRIDVAHYLKKWSDALKGEKKSVKKFYLFAIAQVILCRNKQDATTIIEALLLISQSETAGNGATSLLTAVGYINSLIVNPRDDIEKTIKSFLDNDEIEVANEGQAEDNNIKSARNGILYEWTEEMKKNVNEILQNEEGDDINPRHCPTFANRLLDHMEIIPLWSCICRDAFGYGRVPASSAPVESEFKTIKKQLIPQPLRIDQAVECLVNYYNGKLKLIDCAKRKRDKSISSSVLNDSNLDPSPVKIFKSVDEPVQDVTTLNEEISGTAALEKEAFKKYRSPLKDLSSELNIQNNTCVACKNGDFPSGAHVCVVCGCNVHILEGCSVRIEEEDEGYGERRICITCSKNSAKSSKLALQDFENWRDLGRKKGKKNRTTYLTGATQDLLDKVTSEKLKKLAILKNGNDESLALVTIDRLKLTLINTCPLDSLFQIFLVAITDNDKIKNFVNEHKDINALFKMVFPVLNSTIRSGTYTMRAKIFLDFLKPETKEDTIMKMRCESNVVSLANFLFKNLSSFEEVSTCRAGCKPHFKYLPSVTICGKEIEKPLGIVIKEHLTLPSLRCRHRQCEGIEDNSIHKIGDIILIGVDMDQKITVSSIQQSFECPKTGMAYEFVGAVEYRGPKVSRRSWNKIGHYVAVTKRNSHWVIYDGIYSEKKPGCYEVGNSYELCVELLVYAKK